VSRYQKDKTNLDFIEARDSEWQWHQLGHMQVCTSLQTDNHASTPPRWRQKSTGIDMEQNYVTVTLLMCFIASVFLGSIRGLKRTDVRTDAPL